MLWMGNTWLDPSDGEQNGSSRESPSLRRVPNHISGLWQFVRSLVTELNGGEERR